MFMKGHCALHTKITKRFWLYHGAEQFGGHPCTEPAVANDGNLQKESRENAPFMKDMFQKRNINYNLRRGNGAQPPPPPPGGGT